MGSPFDETLARFLELAVLRYEGPPDPDPGNFERAADIAAAHPELRERSLHAAAALGDVAAVEAAIARAPDALEAPAGGGGWTPLMVAAYARLPGVDTTEVARTLLRHGADPNAARIQGGRYRFSVLTGVLGEGEAGPERQPPHPNWRAFAEALLDAGAEAADPQATYNTMFTPGDAALELLVERGLSPRTRNDWQEAPAETVFGYQIQHALRHGHHARARFLIERGADVDEVVQGRSLHHWALLNGEDALAALMVERGATDTPLPLEERFAAACIAGDARVARALRDGDPDLPARTERAHPRLLHGAAAADRHEAVALMLEMGLDPDGTGHNTPLHEAAWHGHADMLRRLIEAGADPRLRDTEHDAPPLGWALFNGQAAAARVLENHAMDVFTAAARGSTEAIRQRIAEDPALLELRFRAVRRAPGSPSGQDWMTPLAFAAAAGRADMVRVLLSLGADASVHDDEGHDLVSRATEAGDEAVAAALRGQ